MVDEAKLNQTDARKLTEELIQSGETQWQEFERMVSRLFQGGFQSIGIGTREELEGLRRRIDALEKRMSAIEITLTAKKGK